VDFALAAAAFAPGLALGSFLNVVAAAAQALARVAAVGVHGLRA
jgi:hypothetical protein